MMLISLFFIFLVICLTPLNCTAANSSKKLKREPLHGKKNISMFYCPEGYNLEGENTCTQEFISPPVEVCLVGELIAPGKCLLLTKSLLTCPPGYQEAGNTSYYHHTFGKKACTAVKIAPMISECPPNSVSTNEGCVITKQSEIQMVCPLSKKAKHLDHASECVEYDSVAPLPYCANGEKLEGGFCAAVQIVQCPSPKKLSLPLLKGSSNAAFVEAKAIPQHARVLAKQLKKNDAITLCEKPIRAAPNFKCPPGANESAGKHGKKDIQCVVPRVVPLLPVCPIAGGITSPDGALCTATVNVEKLALCPSGFSQCMENKSISHVQSFSGKCCKVDVVSPIPVCPPDFHLQNGECVFYESSVFKCLGEDVLFETNCVGRNIVPAMVELTVAPSQKK